MPEWLLYNDDVLSVLKDLPDNQYDGLFSDPPYGLSFMNADWDAEVPGPEVWAEALRVLKPGAYLMAFGGSRTWFKLAWAIEKAGFVIKDTCLWLYGGGNPKSKKIEAEGFAGFGTALKPSIEPLVVAMKPLDGTYANNATLYGVAGLNVDSGRIPWPDGKLPEGSAWGGKTKRLNVAPNSEGKVVKRSEPHSLGRWPANVVMDDEVAAMLGEPSRFFYANKALRSEKDAGCENNDHPTVKPLALCRYFSGLMLPPLRDSEVRKLLVPFSGSGSEMIGSLQAGWDEVTGIEISEEFIQKAIGRLEHWSKN